MDTPLPPGVILAGGLSRRMGGGDKGLLPFGGGTLLSAVMARVRPQVSRLALNANGDPARFASLGLAVLPDPVPGHPGPLAGILAAMEWAAASGHARVLTVPCDAPCLPPDLLARLMPHPFAVAASAGRRHPVVALWPVALAPALAQALARGERRVSALSHDATPVDFPEAALLNLNTPADWPDPKQ